MRQIGVLLDSDPFRISPIKIGQLGLQSVGVENALHPVGVKAPVAIQIEVKTEFIRSVAVGDHEDRRARVVIQIEEVLAKIIGVEWLAIRIGVTHIRPARVSALKTLRRNKIRRDQKIIGEQIGLRRDARNHLGQRPRLARARRQFGVGQVRVDRHRRPLAAAGAQEQHRHDRHHCQHDQGEDQSDTALRLAIHLAARMGMRCWNRWTAPT